MISPDRSTKCEVLHTETARIVLKYLYFLAAELIDRTGGTDGGGNDCWSGAPHSI